MLIERLFAAIAGPLIARAIGISKLMVCSIARAPPIMPYLFLELQPPKKTVIVSRAKMNSIKIRSPSKAAMPVLPAIGITNNAVKGSVRYRIGVAEKRILSHMAGTMSSFERSLMKSANG